jgi:hypothetical protein
MRTSQECTAKAEELDGRALESAGGLLRGEFEEMAADWRRLALVAEVQEKLEAG